MKLFQAKEDLREIGGIPREEISYSFSMGTRLGKFIVRGVENLSGRQRLLDLVEGYQADLEEGQDFWEVMLRRFGISLTFASGKLENIPRTGPLVVVANHPYGILDGLIMCRVLGASRGEDFRLPARLFFRSSGMLDHVILPLDFSETKEALQTNVRSRSAALNFLKNGGAVGIFPAGAVATAPAPFGHARDGLWKTFAAKMILQSGASVVPVHFQGSNSRAFQVASHLNYTLRMALLLGEFERRVGTEVRMSIGEPIDADTLSRYAGNNRGLMKFLRAETYKLSPEGEQRYPDGLYLG